MQKILKITQENVGEIKPIYEDFRDKALSDYKYQFPPIDFEAFASEIASGVLKGLALLEDETPEGILIYTIEKSNIKKEIVITGNDLGDFGDNKLAWRQAGINYYKKNIQGSYIELTDIGKVRFSSKGIKKTVSSSADETKLKFLPRIKDIIKNGKINELQLPKIPRKDGILGFRYIETPVILNEENIIVVVNVAQDIKGNLFYNLSYKRKLTDELPDRTKPGSSISSKNIIPDADVNFNTIEINAIHSKNRYALLEGLIANLQQHPDSGVISYPILGVQEECVKDIAHLGFKFVGQSVVKFDFQDPVSFRVLKMSQDAALGDNKLAIWDDKYKEQAIELTNLAFKNTKSAYFDPRFLSYEGSKNVLEMILTNQYGPFLPGQSRILLNGETLEGFCFAVMVEEGKINVPLVAVKKDERTKGMGKLLLKSLLGGFVKLISEKKITLMEVNATVDTDNYPAVKMYRRLGFREDCFYPHAYLSRK